MLNRDQIRAADDRKLTEVDVPEWGGRLFVRTLPLADRLALAASARKDGDITADVVILCVCDDAGNRLFEESDAAWLSGKSGAVLQRIALEAIEINGLSAKTTEQAEKN